jgi:putative PEP-CTERM system histidine kinase
MNFGVLTYGFAATSFVFLAIMLRPHPGPRLFPQLRLWVAIVGTCIWAGLNAWQTASGTTSEWSAAWDAARSSLWLVFVTGIIDMQRGTMLLSRTVAWCCASCTLFLAAIAMAWPVAAPGQWHTVLSLSLSLLLPAAGIVAIEQIYRAATAATLSSIRWLSIVVGVMFLYDVVLYADAILYRAVDAVAWDARGAAFGLLAPLLAVATARAPAWSTDLAVSRRVAYYMTSLILIGTLLVTMSVVATMLARGSGAWGRALWSVSLASAVAIFLLFIFSSAIRRRWMVMLTKNFFRQKYDYRREWLRFIRTLSGTEDAGVDDSTAIRAVAQILGSPSGALWCLVEDGRYRLRATWPGGRTMAAIPAFAATDDLPAFLTRTGWVVDLKEWRERPQLYDSLRIDPYLVDLDPDGLVLPLLQVDRLYGFLQLARPPGLGVVGFEDRDLLKTAGRQIAVHLSQQDLERRIAESQRFEAFNRLTAFVMHDLKNVASQLQLVVQNAPRHKHKREFVDDALATVAASVERMHRLLHQLQNDATAEHPALLELEDIANKVALRASGRTPVPKVRVLDGPLLVRADRERLMAVLEHAVRNAQDATGEDGSVVLELDSVQSLPVLRVLDTGKGMSEEFVQQRLFRPFQSTKGARGMGIGAFQIQQYMRSISGDVHVRTTPGEGTCFTLSFPAADMAPPARVG